MIQTGKVRQIFSAEKTARLSSTGRLPGRLVGDGTLHGPTLDGRLTMGNVVLPRQKTIIDSRTCPSTISCLEAPNDAKEFNEATELGTRRMEIVGRPVIRPKMVFVTVGRGAAAHTALGVPYAPIQFLGQRLSFIARVVCVYVMETLAPSTGRMTLLRRPCVTLPTRPFKVLGPSSPL